MVNPLGNRIRGYALAEDYACLPARVRPAAALALAVLPGAAFSVFLVSRGMGPMPDSVVVKAAYLDPARAMLPWRWVLQTLVGNASTAPGVLLSV